MTKKKNKIMKTDQKILYEQNIQLIQDILDSNNVDEVINIFEKNASNLNFQKKLEIKEINKKTEILL